MSHKIWVINYESLHWTLWTAYSKRRKPFCVSPILKAVSHWSVFSGLWLVHFFWILIGTYFFGEIWDKIGFLYSYIFPSFDQNVGKYPKYILSFSNWCWFDDALSQSGKGSEHSSQWEASIKTFSKWGISIFAFSRIIPKNKTSSSRNPFVSVCLAVSKIFWADSRDKPLQGPEQNWGK